MTISERRFDKQKKEGFSRDQFGPGEAGRRAYEIILAGESCRAILENSERCGKRGRETLDFDVIGDLEQLPSCGDDHTEVMRQRIEKDLELMGRTTAFGKNGWGRA